MMNKLALAVALALAAGPASAIATLSLDDGANAITVQDQDANDANPMAGIVTVVWTAPNTLWTSTVSIGTTYPADGSAARPYMDLNAVVTSPGNGALTITFTQDGFLPAEALFLSDVGGTLNQNSSAQFTATADGQPISSIGPFTTGGAFMGTDTSMFMATTTPYAISLQAVITHRGAGTSSFDYQVQVPEPGTVALLGLGLLGMGFLRRRVTA